MSESLTTMLMLGHMMGDTALAEAKVERQRVTFAATVARLTPTALHAMLEAIAAEHVKRYGDDDEGAAYRSRAAMRDEVHAEHAREGVES